MGEQLAIDGGTPIRDIAQRPWPEWPIADETLWSERVEPALREVFLSHVEGLPGPRAESFAERFADYCGTKHARLLVHGTDAIGAALSAVLDLDAWGEGGEVILPNYTFIATASAPLDRRCTLAFVDIDPETFTMDPDALAEAIVPGRTRAVLPVHLAGHPADMDAIRAVADKHGLAVVEDCAQAHGARYKGKPVGSLSHAGTFSFQSTKNLTSGEGGAVTTDDADIDARVAGFMDVGRAPRAGRWEYPRLGWNYRPSEYLAALLSVRLETLDAETDHRAKMADYLTRQLRAVPGVTPPIEGEGCDRHAYHLYCIQLDTTQFGGHSRDAIIRALTAEGIPCSPGYTLPLSETPALAHLRKTYPEVVRVLPCPNAERVCANSLWLTQPLLLAETEDMDDIAEALVKVQRLMSCAAVAS